MDVETRIEALRAGRGRDALEGERWIRAQGITSVDRCSAMVLPGPWA